jgi:hypothetical protein
MKKLLALPVAASAILLVMLTSSVRAQAPAQPLPPVVRPAPVVPKVPIPGARLASKTVTVAKSGTGTGAVTLPGGSVCGTACSATLTAGTYTFIANAVGAKSYFAGWTGDAPASCGRNALCAITVGDKALTVGAKFETGAWLFVRYEGARGTSVVSCSGPQGSVCPIVQVPGGKVTLRTVAAPGNPQRAPDFLEWKGVPGCGTADTCDVTFGTSDITVTAVFTRAVAFNFRGTGSGWIESSPSGTAVCTLQVCTTVRVMPKQTVSFTARPYPGTAFDRWSSLLANPVDTAAINACGSAPTCTFTPTTDALQLIANWKTP